jgi:methylmalonyl-CoA mutase
MLGSRGPFRDAFLPHPMADPRPDPSAPFEPVDIDTWRARVDTELGAGSFEKRLVSHTIEQLEIDPLYPDQGVTAATLPSPSQPGWAIHAEYDAANLERARGEIATDTKRGVRGLRLQGVEADSLESLLDSIDLSHVAVHLSASRSPRALWEALITIASRRGTATAELRGGIGAAPLASEVAELLHRATEETPLMTILAVDTTPYQRAGAGGAQQIAIALATGTEYLRSLAALDVEVEAVASSIEFTFSLGTDFFGEIAKLRAMRLAWARLVAASGGSRNAQCPRIHARSSERSSSTRDPWVNLLRGTTGALAAALGGADSIAVAPFDRCLGHSDELARRLAINTQVILDEEASASVVRDPAAGSGYIETLTEELARGAWSAFRDIEREGGMAKALATGSVQRAIQAIDERQRARVATRRFGLVGVSEFPDLDEERLKRDPLPEDTSRALPPRLAEPFETLRESSDRHLDRTGARPKVFLACLGSTPEFRARATFAANLFATGGIESIGSEGVTDETAAVEAFAASGAKLCAICSTDERYAESVALLAPLLVERGAVVIVAGKPGDSEAAWRDAGVSHFVHLGGDVLSILEALQAAAGVEG